MRLSNDYIENLLFDYFEGNLNDSEKLRLMNLIRHNPELEKEFASWAQSYSYKKDFIEDYGLTNKLIKRRSWLQLKYSISGVVILAVAVLVWFFSKNSHNPKPEKNVPVVVFKPEHVENEKKSEKESENEDVIPLQVPAEIKQVVPSKTNPGKPEKLNEPEKPQILPVVTTPFSASSSDSVGIVSVPPAPAEKKVDVKKVDTVNNSIQKKEKPELVQEDNKTKNTDKSLKKNKRPFSLKPDPNFLPVNPNL